MITETMNTEKTIVDDDDIEKHRKLFEAKAFLEDANRSCQLPDNKWRAYIDLIALWGAPKGYLTMEQKLFRRKNRWGYNVVDKHEVKMMTEVGGQEVKQLHRIMDYQNYNAKQKKTREALFYPIHKYLKH